MFRNYLKITFRLFQKQKVYSLINVTGLAIGLSACIIIFLFVQDELSYDQYHSKKDHIYRLLLQPDNSNGKVAIAPGMAKSMLDEKFPEIKSITRIFSSNANLSSENNTFYENNILGADTNIFTIFDWPLIYGDENTVLNKPNALVLSEKAAKKYFGNENPIGKIIKYNNVYKLEVTGIMKDIPDNTHIKPDFIASVEFQEKLNPKDFTNWGNVSARYYLLLRQGTNIEELQNKIQNTFQKVEESRLLVSAEVYLQKLTDAHLHSKQITWDLAEHGDITNVYLFSLSALFILIIACFNFMNLSTARSVRRAREVGMRKVLGADRSRLIGQFLGESFIYTIVAVLIALLFVELFLPGFNTIAGKSLQFNAFNNPQLIVYLLLIIFLVFIVAGSYPAFVLSSFRPTVVLKGNMMQNARKSAGRYQLRFRQLLVLVQFVICTGLIVGSLFLWKQMHYIQSKPLGFEDENVIIIHNPLTKAAMNRYGEMKSRLRENPYVENFSGGWNMPGENVNHFTNLSLDSDTSGNEYQMGFTVVDSKYFDLLQTRVIMGRDFSEEYALDTIESAIINQTAARMLGLENPVGKVLNGFRGYKSKRIIGVVEDIHYESLREKIDPVVYYSTNNEWPNYSRLLAVKLIPDAPPHVLNTIEGYWNEIEPQWPLRYEYLENRMSGFYTTETYTAKLVGWFTLLVIIVSFAGLYGLTFYMIESRTREIGIRKILGARVGGIILMLSREMLILIALSNIIAWPLIFWFINNWLQKFVYRINIAPSVFIVSGLLVMIIALSTIVFHTGKQARLNPVDAVKFE